MVGDVDCSGGISAESPTSHLFLIIYITTKIKQNYKICTVANRIHAIDLWHFKEKD